MRSVIVSDVSDPQESFATLRRNAVQISRCKVLTTGEQPSAQMLIWPGQATEREEIEKLAEELRASNPECVVSIVVENQESSPHVSGRKLQGDAFKIAASVAVIKASWGWVEAMPIVVRVEEDEFEIYASFDGNEWKAKDHF